MTKMNLTDTQAKKVAPLANKLCNENLQTLINKITADIMTAQKLPATKLNDCRGRVVRMLHGKLTKVLP